jgi:dihydroorotate dehydrogenase electron transfer subunit
VVARHNNPLHAQHYPDRAVQRSVEIIENVPIAPQTFRVRFACPEIARNVVPGQFLMSRIASCNDPLIGRPLALYEVIDDPSGNPWAIDLVYLVKGKFTSRLADCRAGSELVVWGPLGNGFTPPTCETLIMVAGGIGQTPFVAFGQECLGRRSYGSPVRNSASVKRVILCYGARSANYLAGLSDFERGGIELRIATDDGSRGHHGFVTQLLEQTLLETSGERRIVCCGPERMMEAVAGVAQRAEIPCEVSLETPMACGIGICFTCVAKVRDASGNWDYKRTCVEGPIFSSESIEW